MHRLVLPLAPPPPQHSSSSRLHAAGPTDEGFRIIAVWESEPAWQHFRTERLAPAIACLGGAARPEPTFRALRPDHLVVGQAREGEQ